jgi:peptidoglycan/LPS O-acetylase OafA/YrhL
VGLAAGFRLQRLLSSRTLRYIAEISFALYVFHGCLRASWLDTGDKVVKYAKRPLLLGVAWLFAHLSSRYYEAYFIGLGKRWTRKPGTKT